MKLVSRAALVTAAASARGVSFGVVLSAGTAIAAPSCSNQINYAGDPRPNAVINSIGASTGRCPVPIPEAIGLPGYVRGAVVGADCDNYPTYIFGEGPGGC